MEVSKPVAASRLEKAFSQGIRTDYNYKKNQNDSQKVHSLGTFSVISVKTTDEIVITFSPEETPKNLARFIHINIEVFTEKTTQIYKIERRTGRN